MLRYGHKICFTMLSNFRFGEPVSIYCWLTSPPLNKNNHRQKDIDLPPFDDNYSRCEILKPLSLSLFECKATNHVYSRSDRHAAYEIHIKGCFGLTVISISFLLLSFYNMPG